VKKNRLNYAFVDPASGGYSASRIASLWMILIDTVWLWACIKGLPPAAAYGPVSTFLGTCTSVAFAAYGLNSFAGGWKHNVGEIASSVFSKTTTTSQVETGPPVDKPPPAKPPLQGDLA
jgi:hypothetical protein